MGDPINKKVISKKRDKGGSTIVVDRAVFATIIRRHGVDTALEKLIGQVIDAVDTTGAFIDVEIHYDKPIKRKRKIKSSTELARAFDILLGDKD